MCVCVCLCVCVMRCGLSLSALRLLIKTNKGRMAVASARNSARSNDQEGKLAHSDKALGL